MSDGNGGTVSQSATVELNCEHAGPATLDSSFGAGGIVTTDFNSSSDTGSGVAVQSDGKTIVAGYSSSGEAVALARYNVDGSLEHKLWSEWTSYHIGRTGSCGQRCPGPIRRKNLSRRHRYQRLEH